MKSKSEPQAVDPGRALAGILAVLIAQREDAGSNKAQQRKIEAILAEAGMTLAEISAVTGKSYEAVKKAVSRAA